MQDEQSFFNNGFNSNEFTSINKTEQEESPIILKIGKLYHFYC